MPRLVKCLLAYVVIAVRPKSEAFRVDNELATCGLDDRVGELIGGDAGGCASAVDILTWE